MAKNNDEIKPTGWKLTSIVSSWIVFALFIIWFLVQPSFEPLIGLIGTGFLGILSFRHTENKYDMFVTVVIALIAGFGVFYILLDTGSLQSNEANSPNITDNSEEVISDDLLNENTNLESGNLFHGIPGKIAYAEAGRAWIIEKNIGNKRAINIAHDLDGRIFKLSPSGEWLLFSVKSTKLPDEEINTLWVVNINNPNSTPIDLQISNVVLYADFIPGNEQTISYSTVKPQSSAPGWQANNNLIFKSYTTYGALSAEATVIEDNSGGVYGWWGSKFSWSPRGKKIAWVTPEGVRLGEFEESDLSFKEFRVVHPFIPLSTFRRV